MSRLIDTLKVFFTKRDVAPEFEDEEWVPTYVDESRLTRAKRSWAKQGRFLNDGSVERSEDRLPPGQHLVEGWPVLDLGIKPEIDLVSWKLEIAGSVENPVTLNWDQFLALPQVERINDIHCVTSWSRFDNHWKGVAISELIALSRPISGVKAVMLHGFDGYTTNLLIEDFAAEGGLLAREWSNFPLDNSHGGPVRLVVPHLYFWKSAKWLKKIEFTENADIEGFWEVGGYHRRGDPWMQERYKWSNKT